MSSLYLLSANVICDKLFPLYGDQISECLPSCIKATILYLLTKRGSLGSLTIFRNLLNNFTTSLDLSAQINADDHYLEAISKANLTNLFKIDFNALKGMRLGVTDRGISALSKSQSSHCLEVIFFRRCELVSDDSICQLVQSCCSHLRSLCLAGCPEISDETLFTVAKACSHLEGIDVSSTAITDRGLEELSSSQSICQTLKEIKMTKCLNITVDGIQSVMRNCNRIEICRFDGCRLIDANDMAMILENLNHRQLHRNTDGFHHNLKQVSWTIY